MSAGLFVEDELSLSDWLAAYRDRYGPVGSDRELRELYRDGMSLEAANRWLLKEGLRP